MSLCLVSAIPPQPNTVDDSDRGVHLYTCIATGQRVVYGTTSGVVVRTLPDQISFDYAPVQSYIGVRKPILCACMSRDNKTVVGGDSDGTVYVWTHKRSSISQQIFKLADMQWVKLADLSISPDGMRLAAVGTDRYAQKLGSVILVNAGNAVGQIGGHSKGILSVHFRPLVKKMSLISGGLDGLLGLHEGPPYRLVKFVEAHAGGVKCARFSPDGQGLASVGKDGSLAFWNPDTLEPKGRINLPGSPNMFSLAWSPDSKLVAVIAKDKALRVYNADTKRLEAEVSVDQGLENDDPRGLGWTLTGWILVICVGGHIKGWKVSASHALTQHVDDEKLYESALKDHMQRIEDDTTDTLSTPTTVGSATTAIAKSATQTKSLAQTLAFSLKPPPDFIWHGQRGSPTAIAFDREHGNLVVGTSLGYLMFLSTVDSIPTAFQVSKLPSNNTVKSTIFGPGFACACTSDGTLRIYRVVGRQLETKQQFLHTLDVMGGYEASLKKGATCMSLIAAADIGERRTPLKLALFDEGKYVGVFCVDGTFLVYDVSAVLSKDTGGTSSISPLWSTRLPGRLLAVSVTPDGSLFALALYPGPQYPLTKFGENMDGDRQLDVNKPLIEIYEVDSAQSLSGFRFICVLTIHDVEVTSLALNPEGCLLASADANRNLFVTEIETHRIIINDEWRYHTTKIVCMDWSPDGTKLTTSSTDGRIHVWDVDRPVQSSVIMVDGSHSGGCNFVKFLFNNIVASGGNDGNVKVYEVEYAHS